MAQTADPLQLRPRTVEAFDRYIKTVELAAGETLRAAGPFLWSQMDSARAQKIRAGQVGGR